MIAVIVATGLCSGMEPLSERYPIPLLPLVDRPFIQHVVEFLVEGGITRFEFVLCHLPEKIERLLGDGSRWGSEFRFHLTRDPERPYEALKTMSFDNDAGPVLLAHADRLPQIDMAQTRPEHALKRPLLFLAPPVREIDAAAPADREKLQWTGWAWVPAHILKNLEGDLDEEALKAHLTSIEQSESPAVEVSLSVRSYEDILASQAAVLGKKFSGLFLGGKEADESIWLSRNVTLHPTATLVPPVYIGRNCRIGKGTRLGPDAIIGKNCMLDSGCTVTSAVIFPGSYVGEGLELDKVLVDKNRLINVKFGAAVSISESFILGGLSKAHLGERFARVFSRFGAACLLILLCPFLFATALVLRLGRRGPVIFTEEALRLPAQTDEPLWHTFRLFSFTPEGKKRESKGTGLIRHFFLQFLPGLINILRGELCFVGVRPRTKDQVKALPRDWQTLYLNSKPGIITEALINYGASPTEDELYTSEVFYSVSSGIGHDFNLLIGYLSRILGFSPSQ